MVTVKLLTTKIAYTINLKYTLKFPVEVNNISFSKVTTYK